MTRAKDVLPNIHRTQAAVSVYCRHPVTPGCDVVVSSAAPCSVRRTAHVLLCIVGMTQQLFVFVPSDLDLWPLTFDLDIQTRPSEASNMCSLWTWRKSVQRFPRYLRYKRINKSQTALKTEPYLRAVNN